jgi:hypothetical protein
LGDVTQLNLNLPYSFTAWVYTTGTGGYYIYGKGPDSEPASGNYYGAVFYFNSDTLLTAQFGDGSGSGSANRHRKQATIPSVLNKWAHVAAVVNGKDDITLYVNGSDVGGSYSGTASTVAYNSSPALIGAFYDGAAYDYFFNGKIDDVQIFNYALTTQQIRDVYNSGAVRFGP